MAIRGGALPGLGDGPVSECALGGDICSTKKDIEKMKQFLFNSGLRDIPNDKKKIVEYVMHKLGVSKESDVYDNPDYQSFIGRDNAKNVLDSQFLPLGPANSTDLLDNFNIDGALDRWTARSDFGKKFHHVPFQMIDFMKQGTELSKLLPSEGSGSVLDLMKKGFDSFGVVLNTDVSSGRGIHWFCIYGDLAHKGTKEDPICIEYFNSSGYPPKPEVQYWLDRLSRRTAKSWCCMLSCSFNWWQTTTIF